MPGHWHATRWCFCLLCPFAGFPLNRIPELENIPSSTVTGPTLPESLWQCSPELTNCGVFCLFLPVKMLRKTETRPSPQEPVCCNFGGELEDSFLWPFAVASSKPKKFFGQPWKKSARPTLEQILYCNRPPPQKKSVAYQRRQHVTCLQEAPSTKTIKIWEKSIVPSQEN